MGNPKGDYLRRGAEVVGIIAGLATIVAGILASVNFLEDHQDVYVMLLHYWGFVQQWWPVLLAGIGLVAVGLLLCFLRRQAVRPAKSLRTLGKQLRWRLLWLVLEGDVRARIVSLNRIGAEVLVAVLRVGERRQDRRLFMSISAAEELVRSRRRGPQAGIGGTNWAKKGCQELEGAGLVDRFGDARKYEYMIWLEPRVLKSRVGDRVADVVEGLLARRDQWQW